MEVLKEKKVDNKIAYSDYRDILSSLRVTQPKPFDTFEEAQIMLDKLPPLKIIGMDDYTIYLDIKFFIHDLFDKKYINLYPTALADNVEYNQFEKEQYSPFIIKNNIKHYKGSDGKYHNGVKSLPSNVIYVYETCQCSPRRRTLVDIYRVCKNYYPNTTLKEVKEALFTIPLCGSICNTIKRRVHDKVQKNTYNFMVGYYGYIDEFGWDFFCTNVKDSSNYLLSEEDLHKKYTYIKI